MSSGSEENRLMSAARESGVAHSISDELECALEMLPAGLLVGEPSRNGGKKKEQYFFVLPLVVC
jgi:hypothetical protein